MFRGVFYESARSKKGNGYDRREQKFLRLKFQPASKMQGAFLLSLQYFFLKLASKSEFDTA